MTFTDKLKFWKKEEDDFSDLGDFGMNEFEGSQPTHDGNLPSQSPRQQPQEQAQPYSQSPPPQPIPEIAREQTNEFSMNEPEQMSQPNIPRPEQIFPNQQQRMNQQFPPPQMHSQNDWSSKDMEIISAKLDALKATLENINQRLANLERIAQNDGQQKYAW